jgi:hypothetical protein
MVFLLKEIGTFELSHSAQFFGNDTIVASGIIQRSDNCASPACPRIPFDSDTRRRKYLGLIGELQATNCTRMSREWASAEGPRATCLSTAFTSDPMAGHPADGVSAPLYKRILEPSGGEMDLDRRHQRWLSPATGACISDAKWPPS